MFSRRFLLGNNTMNIYCLLKRNFNMKKLRENTLGNPFLTNIAERQMEKTQRQGVFKRLVEKRTSEYNEYFPKPTDTSVIKRTKHVSYDHVGQKRAIHLSKILRSFLTDRIGSGEIGDTLAGKDFHLTNIIVPVDLNRIEVLWWSPEHEASAIEEVLKTAGEQLRTAIRHAQLLPNLPPVIFKRDEQRTDQDQINNLIDTADKGEPSDDIAIVDAKERTDLYDSDRTVILRKLTSDQSAVTSLNDEEQTDMTQLSLEQMQRRMKAFALTKRMQRVQEQRSAIYGIMEIEKERRTQEHFSISETRESELEQESSSFSDEKKKVI